MNYRLLIISFHICTVILFNNHVVAQINKDTTSEDTLLSYSEDDDDTISIDTVLQINSFAVNHDSVAGYKRDKDFSYMNYLDSLLRNSKDLAVDTVSSDNLKGEKKLNRSARFRINRQVF